MAKLSIIEADKSYTFVDHFPLYGAVSIGNVWQFAQLTTDPPLIIQDINLWRVPTDLAELFQILIGILTSP